MTDPRFIIPAHRLPPGFAETLDTPPARIAEPRPAATVVLMRDGAQGLEVLLLKRHRSSGFVPGAYVFPGGRTDEADADPQLVQDCRVPEPADVAAFYWFGAVREVFEETGVLLAQDAAGEWAADTSISDDMEAWREQLMSNTTRLVDMLAATGLRVVLDDVVYFAHWITPEVEPRRYDTRFFVAALPPGRQIRPDEREMVDAIWITPAAALKRFEAGQLPMVFPTVFSLQDLAQFKNVADTLAALRERPVAPVMPRLVRAGDGVGIVIDREKEVE